MPSIGRFPDGARQTYHCIPREKFNRPLNIPLSAMSEFVAGCE
jgi:hypothetical protein